MEEDLTVKYSIRVRIDKIEKLCCSVTKQPVSDHRTVQPLNSSIFARFKTSK